MHPGSISNPVEYHVTLNSYTFPNNYTIDPTLRVIMPLTSD